MKQRKKGLLCLFLTAVLALGAALPAFGAEPIPPLQAAATKAGEYLYQTVKTPQLGSIGGEWVVLGLARGGYPMEKTYTEAYYQQIEQAVIARKGLLHERKYTENSRVILAVSALGKDARNVGGYDLTKPLGDYEKTVWQGLNGPILALLALDCRDYPMPQNPAAKTQATRQRYVEHILACQLENGGWSLTAQGGKGTADPDLTGMALQALARYQTQPKVQAAVEKALLCLSDLQDAQGGYTSRGVRNLESAVQVMVGLCAVGVDPADSRFVKNGNSLIGHILSCQRADGSFLHTADGSGSNQMATEQAYYGMVALLRSREGRQGLYDMREKRTEQPRKLAGKPETQKQR